MNPVAVLDRAGEIVGASLSWRALAGHDRVGVIGAIGENYLEVCDDVADQVSGAAALRKGLIRVLGGSMARIERVCWLETESGRRDYRIVVTHLRLASPHRYLVVQEEVTELAKAKAIACEARERVCAAQAEERRQLAKNLHDSVGQNLVSLGLGLARLRRITPQTDGVASVMDDLTAALRDAHAQIRTVSYLLHPPWPEAEGGLEVAVRDLVQGFAQRAGLQVDMRVQGAPCKVDRAQELTLFRILQEGLVNIHRHAHANAILVELDNRGSEVVLQVRDDGCGFAATDGAPITPGVGLLGMRDRVTELGGELLIDTGPAGTTLKVRLPTQAISSLKPRPDSLIDLAAQAAPRGDRPSPRTSKSLAKTLHPGPGHYATP
ncbi:MAG: sensor histidine kinase [Phenylobacterium sp.]